MFDNRRGDVHMNDMRFRIEELLKIQAPSGREDKMREKLESYLLELGKEYTIDPYGNLIVHIKGIGPRIMLSAHMDQSGFIATYADESGLMYFDKVGRIQPEQALGCRVEGENGQLGIITQAGAPGGPKDVFIDSGTQGRQESHEEVPPGTRFLYTAQTRQTGSKAQKIVSPYLHNAAGCAVLLELADTVQRPCYDCYFVFTVQGETGAKGALTSSDRIRPRYHISLDAYENRPEVGNTFRNMKTEEKRAPVKARAYGMGAGCTLIQSVCCGPAREGVHYGVPLGYTLLDCIEDAAYSAGIPIDTEAAAVADTEAGTTAAAGRTEAVALMIPCRYLDTPNETVAFRDIENLWKLLGILLKEGQTETLV